MGVRENEEQLSLLYARLDDLCELSERGELGISDFLSPADEHFASLYLKKRGASFFTYGGYLQAERQRVYILPDYMDIPEGEQVCERLDEYGFSTETVSLRITGSGYRKLSHRDFLGSLLGLGIERAVLGDILVMDDEGREAVILCDRAISEYILGELTHIANDKVRVSIANKDEWAAPPRRMQPIYDTVASGRLDAVVAALCNLSRDKARTAVVSGLVELDFESEERPDRTVTAPAVISVRGFGRFCVNSLSVMTRKGRYRLEAEKYL